MLLCALLCAATTSATAADPALESAGADEAHGTPTASQPSGTSAQAGAARCPEAIIYQGTGIFTQTKGLRALNIGCARARAIAYRFLSSSDSIETDTSGFTCSRGAQGVRCRKGRTRISWGYFGPDRRCGSAFSEPDQPGFELTANGIACATARRLTRAIVIAGRVGPRSCTIGRPCRHRAYACVALPGEDLLYRVFCSAHARRFSFGGGS